jgi:hypothetical protein
MVSCSLVFLSPCHLQKRIKFTSEEIEKWRGEKIIFPNKKLPHLRCLWFSALQSTFLWSLERNEKRWRPFQITMYWRLRFWQVSECGESERAAAYAIAFSGGGEGTRENGGVLFCGFAMAAAALFLPPMLGCWSLGARFINRPVMLCTKFVGLAFLQKIANYPENNFL